MHRRTRVLVAVATATLLLLSLAPAATAQAVPPAVAAQADAYGVAAHVELLPIVGVELLDIPPTPTTSVALPGDLPVDQTSVTDVGPLFTDPGSLGTVGLVELTSAGQLGQGGSAVSRAHVADVDLVLADLLGDGGLVTADAIDVVSTTTCAPQTPEEAAAGTRFLGLSVGGQELPLTAPVGTEIPLPGLVRVALNEVVPDTDGKGWTVRGLVVRVLDPLTNLATAEVVIGEAHSSVACDGDVEVPEPATDLVADKTADVTAVERGGTFTYDITVTNTSEGTCTITGVADRLPRGVTPTALGGAFEEAEIAVADGVLQVPLDTALAAGEALTGTITVAVDDDAVGPLLNDATASSTACGSARTGLTAPVTVGGPVDDQDDDGVPDADDNCPTVPNADQADEDGDGIGDVCDPVDDTPVDPIPGDDDVEVVTGISQDAFDGADTVVVARSDVFADALTATVLATEVDGPILLTEPGALRPEVAEEIERLGATAAYLIGGEDALSPAVADALEARDVAVTRVDGATRYDTARLVADEVVDLGGPVRSVVLARAGDFPDAMSGANLATWARHPILLTDTDRLQEVTATAMEDLLQGGATVTIAGGTSAVDAAVEDAVTDLGFTTDRVEGETRYGTSVAFVDAARAIGAGLTPTWMSSGERFQGALAAAVAARTTGGTLLLTAPTSLDGSPETRTWLEAHGAGIDEVKLAGSDIGPGLADEVQEAIR